MTRPLIAITPGEPAGIGPELAVKILAQDLPARVVLIGSRDLLLDTAASLGQRLDLQRYDPDSSAAIQCLDVPLTVAAVPGRLDPGNAGYVLRTLELAVDGCSDQRFQGMVTGPVHKGVINDAGIAFTGHTEFLADRTGTGRVVMMLACEALRVALVTTHLPLARVPAAITRQRVDETIRIVLADLRQRFQIAAPRILVCGLNPHAGEGGHLGDEEERIIAPAIRALQQQGIQVDGPLPADTAFTPRALEHADAVIAMYHDQGLPVLKYAGFGRAINITLGLPILRTSVDHGTALDIAGSGQADPGSLLAALRMAARLAGTS